MSIHGLVLEVKVTGCRRLRDTEFFTRQDPYVVLEYATTKLRTRTCTGMLSQFPPQTVRLKVPFSIKPWTRSEDNVTKLLMFAVLYESRSNTGIDRMKIINVVAKCVPQPHKVDLNKPDKATVVQIAKTICLIGVVEKYKELAKFNQAADFIRQVVFR